MSRYIFIFFFSSRGRHTRCALVTGSDVCSSDLQPLDSARAALLLQVAIPALETKAASLRDELGDLAVLRTRIALERDDLVAAAAALNSERDRLSALLARKAELQATTEAERQVAEARIARLAGEARERKDTRGGTEWDRPWRTRWAP